MRRNLVFLAAAVLGTAAALVPGTAYAHGGRGPPGEIPPDASRNPEDPPPPPEGLPPEGPPTEDDWSEWWLHNHRELLARCRTTRRAPLAERELRRVTDDSVTTVVVSRLRTLLADNEESLHVRSAAALALGRIGDPSSAPLLRDLATNPVRDHHRRIEETATLALGLLPPDPRTRAFLLGRVLTPEDARRSFRRPFAAIALGLLRGTPEERRLASRALFEAIACEEPESGMRPACFVAIGLLGDESAIPELVELVTERGAASGAMRPLSSVERSFAVEALARIGSPGPDGMVVDALIALVERSRIWVADGGRRAAVVALGPIAARNSARIPRAAALLRELSSDGQVAPPDRHLALVSLGRLGTSAAIDARTKAAIVAHLRSVMVGDRPSDAPLAAHALALVSRAIREQAGRAAGGDVRTSIRMRFARETDAHAKSAFAIASGLAGDEDAVPALRATLADVCAATELRGWCALALGMIGDQESVAPIRAVLQADGDRELRMRAAMAAGVLGDAAVVEDLTAAIENFYSSVYELGSAALALGQIGDTRAIAALLDIAGNRRNRHTDLTRALAVVALGQIGARRDAPTLARIAFDRNYTACDPAITELLTIY